MRRIRAWEHLHEVRDGGQNNKRRRPNTSVSSRSNYSGSRTSNFAENSRHFALNLISEVKFSGYFIIRPLRNGVFRPVRPETDLSSYVPGQHHF